MVTVKPICRFCSSDSALQEIKGEFVYGGKPEQHFWRCSACEMIYLYPSPTAEEEKRFYRQEFEKFMKKRGALDKDWSTPKKHFQTNWEEAKRRLAILKPYLKQGDRILEIGCSSGFMLNALKNIGMEVFGIDPSEGFIDFVRKKGIPVFVSIDGLRKEIAHSFDFIIHYYVLEHVRDPVEFIRKYLTFLSPNGKMLFEVPSATDPLIDLYRVDAFDRFYWSAVHHWYFTPQSLTKVIQRCNCRFELFPEQRYDLSNHMTWMNEGKPGGTGKFADIFGKELDELYKKRLREYWHCDTIVALVNER